MGRRVNRPIQLSLTNTRFLTVAAQPRIFTGLSLPYCCSRLPRYLIPFGLGVKSRGVGLPIVLFAVVEAAGLI